MSKEKILNIAAEEFAKYGYEGLSMNNLAKKLELNKATIYYHFEDKFSLYNEVLKSIISEKQDELHQLAYTNKPAKTRLQEYIHFLTYQVVEDSKIISIFFREMANFGNNVDNTILEFFKKDIKALENIFKDLEIKQNYTDVDIHSFKFLIVGTIMSYYSIHKSSHEFKEMKKFKNNEELVSYLSSFISNIILDSIYKGEAHA